LIRVSDTDHDPAHQLTLMQVVCSLRNHLAAPLKFPPTLCFFSPSFLLRFEFVTPPLTVEGELIWNSPDLALSSDGRRLLIARLDQETDDLMLINNFR
jgi:hypothetical protein